MTAKTRFIPAPEAAAEHSRLLADVVRHRAALETACCAWANPNMRQIQLKALLTEAAYASAARFVAYLPTYYAPDLATRATPPTTLQTFQETTMNSTNIVYTRIGAVQMDNALMLEVLQPFAYFSGPAPRHVNEAYFAPGSAQDSALSLAAQPLRDIYYENIRQPWGIDFEVYMDACAQTYIGTYDVIEANHPDEKEAAIALAILRRAGLCDGRLKPIYAAAREAIREAAINGARGIRNIFATQETLAFG